MTDTLAAYAAWARRTFPGRSPDWYTIYVVRVCWYIAHDGDMTDAPHLPEDR